MLLTDGSIHLFIQSGSRQYNVVLLTSHTGPPLPLSLHSPTGERGVEHSQNTVPAFIPRTCKIFMPNWIRLSCLFICLFFTTIHPISTIKPFTAPLQFTLLKYLSKSIIVCRGQLLCFIIYHLLPSSGGFYLECAHRQIHVNPFVSI